MNNLWLPYPANKPSDEDYGKLFIIAVKNPYKINKYGYSSAIPDYQIELATWTIGGWLLNEFKWDGQHLSNKAAVVFFLKLPNLPGEKNNDAN